LDVVIIVLRVVLCGELALAITAAWLRTFPADFSVDEYVGVASENARGVSITLARRCVNESPVGTWHVFFNSVDNGPALLTAWPSHRLKNYFDS